MTATETTTVEEVSIKMRLGKAEDFRIEVPELDTNGIWKTIKKPKIGQPYWLKSQVNNQFDNRNYQISEDTDWTEFKDYLRRDMVYVPLSYFELLEINQ
ncbi:MAG: hypothetical protein CMO82_11035 [Winogradskyella sp.]|jgi:hypothetical protein|nr:hypothetical protein [Winogradskyella sp.]|tara:strand:+ start:325 stop:621 length:297 start_codon:yes stop_codon:yes gene_type:complete